MRKITEELIASIKELRTKGMTYVKIAETLGISKTTASKYGRETNGISTIKKVAKRVVVEDIVGIPIKTKLSRKELKAVEKADKKRRKALKKLTKKHK